jgi:tetratricopeptide (TPR) repeat protein
MHKKLPSRLPLTLVLLSIISLAVPRRILPQAPPKMPDSGTALAAARGDQQPFDKLELFGFFAAGPIDTYARQVIDARGTTFKPDWEFIRLFPYSGQQDVLRDIKPRATGTISPDRNAAYTLLRRAWEANRNRQFAAASESYQQALLLAPSSATLHLAYATNLLLSQNYTGAEAQARQSLKLWPENAEGHGVLALALIGQKQFAEAEPESRETLRIFPDHRSAKYTLALCLINEKKYKEAIPAVQDAILVLPQTPALRKFLGIALFETGDVSEGISQLRLAVKDAPDDAEGHYYLGAALRSDGRLAEAHAQFAEALRLQPENPVFEAAAHPGATPGTTDAHSGPKPEDGSISENVYTNRFFGFTYEFPKGWTSLSSDSARAVLEIGGAVISTGDPTEADVKRVVAKKGHSLLFVVKGRTGNQPISMNTVMVNAVEIGTAQDVTPDSFLKSMSRRFNHTTGPIDFVGAPQETAFGNRSFWKENFTVTTAAGDRHGSYLVTKDQGYLLMFVLGAADSASLLEIEKSLASIRFGQASN